MRKIKFIAPLLMATSATSIVCCSTTQKKWEINLSDNSQACIVIDKNTKELIECKIKLFDTSKEISNIKVIIGSKELKTEEFSFNTDSGVLIIPKSTLDKYKGKVTIDITTKALNVVVPSEFLNINNSGTLLGFKDGITILDKYTTIVLPNNVKKIANNAFSKLLTQSAEFLERKYETKLPSNIKYIEFEKGSTCTEIGDGAFASSSIVNINFTNAQKLETINDYSFYNSKLIKLDLSLAPTNVYIGECGFANNYDLKYLKFGQDGVAASQYCFAIDAPSKSSLAVIDLSNNKNDNFSFGYDQTVFSGVRGNGVIVPPINCQYVTFYSLCCIFVTFGGLPNSWAGPTLTNKAIIEYPDFEAISQQYHWIFGGINILLNSSQLKTILNREMPDNVFTVDSKHRLINSFATSRTEDFETRLPNNYKTLKFNGGNESKLKEIGGYAFSNAPFEGEVVFPDNLEIINKCAFEDAGCIEKIVLNKNIKIIGESAFGITNHYLGDKKLNTIDISKYSKVPDWKDTTGDPATNIFLNYEVTTTGNKIIVKTLTQEELTAGGYANQQDFNDKVLKYFVDQGLQQSNWTVEEAQ